MRLGITGPRPAARSLLALALHRTAWLVSIVGVALGASVVSPLAHAARATRPAVGRDVPATFNGTAAVGALFTTSGGKLGAHFCTASVVSSPAGNLVITAAHCVQGKSLSPASSIVFVPGYHNGKFPYGTWPVTAVYVDSAWAADQNPDDDVAFLTVGRPGSDIQRLTGAETLMVDPLPQLVQVIGYPNVTNQPITCTALARQFSSRQMVFDCDGYTNGTSGGPFLANVSPQTGDGLVIGVIGGYQQGGDTADISYSPRFTASVLGLYQTATSANSASGSG